MPTDWQTPLALAVTALAAAWLVRRAWRWRRNRHTHGACGGENGCDCPGRRRIKSD